MKRLLLIVLTVFSFNIYADDADDAVEYRQAVFKLFQANFADMGAMMKGDKPFNARVFNKRAINLKALSSMPWEYFEVEGSDIAGNTKAKDAIWNDPQAFKKKYTDFKKKITDLDNIAKSNDTIDDVKIAFVVAAKTCKNCHKQFRER